MKLKRINYIVKIIIFIHCFNILLSCSQNASNKKVLNKEEVIYSNQKNTSLSVSYEIISIGSTNFGYKIFVNNRIYINQKQIPALNGNKLFKTKVDAENVAMLIVEKIKKDQVPPTITLEELDSLNVEI